MFDFQDEVTQIYGIRFVIDATDVGWDHAKEIAKGLPAQMMKILQVCPASVAQRAERRTRDRKVPGSKLACTIWFFP